MEINGLSGTMASQLYQQQTQKSAGQVVQPAPPHQPQPEESVATQNRDTAQGAEAVASTSINVYA